MRNPALPTLLRAISNSTAVRPHHRVIFNAAADELERLDQEVKELRDLDWRRIYEGADSQ